MDHAVTSIWITRGNYTSDRVYRECDGYGSLDAVWNGQNRGRCDSLVVDGRHCVHVFYRRQKGAFTYYGVVDNATIAFSGNYYDHDEDIPATYNFAIKLTGPELLAASGTVCTFRPEYADKPYRWKRSAMAHVGLCDVPSAVSGILVHSKRVATSALVQTAATVPPPVPAAPAPVKITASRRNMRECFTHGQRVRHVIGDEVQVAVYDAGDNKLVHGGVVYTSVSGFAVGHHRASNAEGRPSGTANGWTECECETASGDWVIADDLRV
jgi:hypothetical protein